MKMKRTYRNPDELDRHIATSMGELQPDLLITGGDLVNVATGEIYKADIATKDNIIVRTGDCSDFFSKYRGAIVR